MDISRERRLAKSLKNSTTDCDRSSNVVFQKPEGQVTRWRTWHLQNYAFAHGLVGRRLTITMKMDHNCGDGRPNASD